MPIPLLSFFTGGGFLDMGFEQEGFRVVWMNEHNTAFLRLHKKAYSTWRRRKKLPQYRTYVEESSIENLTHSKILADAFHRKKPHVFGVIGAPPCPDFSHAGQHKGHNGINGKLTKTYVELLCQIKPAFFVLENVSGLAKFARNRKFLDRMKLRLERSGYAIDEKILNALEFGVPQHRERLFVVGIKKSFANRYFRENGVDVESSWFPWPANAKYPNAQKVYKWPGRVKLGERPRKPKGIPDELCVSSCLIQKHDWNRIPNANNIFNVYSKKFHRVKEGDTTGKSFKRLHRYRYSPTACYGNNEVHLHPWEPRRLSLREVMRIQGVPESYVLPKDVFLTTAFKMVSNGVPVPLARVVAGAMNTLIAKIESANKRVKNRRRTK
jgi:DNA (cytosine-5)-methyltransferase 1